MLKKKLMLIAGALLLATGCANTGSNEVSTTSAGSDETTTASTTASSDSTQSAATEAYPLINVDPYTIDSNKYVDVTNWKNVTVSNAEIELDDYTLDYYFAKELEDTFGFEKALVSDGKVQPGDVANIDFTGYIDGVAFENGAGTDYDLTIGSNSFISGFEQSLVGVKSGETVTIDVTFPENYKNADLAGKPAQFEVTINSVSRVNVPDGSEDNIKEKSDGKYSTYDELAEGFRVDLKETYRNSVIWQKVMANGIEEKEKCQELIDEYYSTYLHKYSVYADKYSMKVEEILAMFGYSSVDAFKTDYASYAEAYAKQVCVILAIADQENITVDDSEVEAKYNEQLANYDSVSAAEEAGITKNDVKLNLVLTKVRELICGTIEVADAEAETESAAEETTAEETEAEESIAEETTAEETTAEVNE